MPVDTKKDIYKRGKILSNYISLDTIVARAKIRLLYEYNHGAFYNVPLDIFDTDNEKDKMLLDEMKHCFIEATGKNQFVPSNLFNLETTEECEKFIEILENKSENGINLFFDSRIEDQLSQEQKERLKRIKEKPKDTMLLAATLNVDRQLTLKERMELNSKSSRFYKYMKINSDQSPRVTSFNNNKNSKPRKKILFFNKNFYQELLNDAKGIDELAEDEKYEIMPFFSIIDDKFIGHTRARTIDEIREVTDELRENVRKQYERFVDKDVSKILESEELFEEYKKSLIEIIEGLDACGCLTELINKENKNIRKINEFLPPECALEKVSKQDLVETIRSFDMTKKEDVIDLLKYSRHFSNKLAHTIDDYMYTTLYFDTKGQVNFDNRRLSGIANVDSKLKTLFNINFNDQNQYDGLKNKILSMDLTYQKYKKQLQKLNEKLSTETDPDEKRKIQKKIDKKDAEIRNKENDFDKRFAGFEDKKKHNPFAADTIINQYIANLDTVFIKKFETKEEYTKAVLEELICIMDDYKKAIIEKRGVSFTECPSYLEFFKAVQWEDKKELYPEFNSLMCERDGVEYNIADELRNFIKTCQTDGIFYASRVKMRILAEQYDMHEYAYNIKHNDTLGLIGLIENGESQIFIQQTPSIDKKDGVIDLFEDGSIQIFGSHFKFDEPEASDSRITLFERVPEALDKLFSETGRRISLNTDIPMKRLRPDQKAAFVKLSETIEYLESGVEELEKEQTLLKLEELRALKTTPSKKISYEALKVRILLGTGLDKYKEYYSTRDADARETIITEENTGVLSAANADITAISEGINLIQRHGTTQSDLIAHGQEILELAEEERIEEEEIEQK